MGARPAEVETADPGKPVAGMAEEGSPGEELVEGMLAVHRMAPGEAEVTL